MTDVPVDLRNTMLALVSTVRVVLLEKKKPIRQCETTEVQTAAFCNSQLRHVALYRRD